MVLLFVFNFADANRRALISRLNEQRQAKLRFDIGKAELRAVGAGECDKRGDGEPGVAQQTFGHVFVHTGRRAQHIGADERQIRHAQHPLQGAIFTQRAVDDRENHIDGRQRLAAFGVNQLLRFAARDLRQSHRGRAQGNAGRILCVEQVVAGVVDVPQPLFINTQQNHIEARFINRFHDILR